MSNITTVLWAGDADFVCNWMSSHTISNDIEYSEQAAFRAKPLAPYIVNGVVGGSFKAEANLSFLQVYGAGHQVPSYSELCHNILLRGTILTLSCSAPELALQVFRQTMHRKQLESTWVSCFAWIGWIDSVAKLGKRLNNKVIDFLNRT
jgi:hypothetical protein